MRAPTLFLSGLADQLIPPRMMMELYQVRVGGGGRGVGWVGGLGGTACSSLFLSNVGGR